MKTGTSVFKTQMQVYLVGEVRFAACRRGLGNTNGLRPSRALTFLAIAAAFWERVAGAETMRTFLARWEGFIAHDFQRSQKAFLELVVGRISRIGGYGTLDISARSLYATG